MNPNFKSSYSKYYDALYSDKNYERESKYILDLINRYSKLDVRSVLDVACGTGMHAYNLAKSNLVVVASDLSSDMISIARTRKISESNPKYSVRDMRSLDLIGKFEVAICMFSAFNYLISYPDIDATLSGIKKNLRPGGLFVLDIWNGIAVLNQRPSTRVKHVERPGLFLVRYSEPRLDTVSQIINVNFKLIAFEEKFDKPLLIDETHKLRYFFPEELTYILNKNGFDVVNIHPFLEPDRKLNENDWNMTVVARSRDQ